MTRILKVSKDGKSSVVTVSQLVDTVKREIAITHYLRFGDDELLKREGISPRSLKRPEGRPPKYKVMRDAAGRNVGAVWKDEDIVQLVLKQKWMMGWSFSNNPSYERNQCFLNVAELMGCSVKQIKKKWDRVGKQKRDHIELWLLRIMLDQGKVHRKKIKKAKNRLGVSSPQL